MSSSSLDLLQRVVAAELGDRQCPGCQRPLSEARVNLRLQEVDCVLAEVTCRSCGESAVLEVKPEPSRPALTPGVPSTGEALRVREA